MPWQPASHGRLFTSVSVAVSMIVIVAVSVFAVKTHLPFGLTGVWIGRPPNPPLIAPVIGS